MVEAKVLLQLVHASLEVTDGELHLGDHPAHLLEPEGLVLQLGGDAGAPVEGLHPLLQLPQPRYKATQVNLKQRIYL